MRLQSLIGDQAEISCGPLPPFTRKSTAMRTARPLVTCSKITERPQSAISLSISTAAINRSGMHDDHVGFGPVEAVLVESEQGGVFVDAGNIVMRWRSC